MSRRNSEISLTWISRKGLILVASFLLSVTVDAEPLREQEVDFYDLAQSFASCSSGLNIVATLMNEQVRPALEGSARGAYFAGRYIAQAGQYPGEMYDALVQNEKERYTALLLSKEVTPDLASPVVEELMTLCADLNPLQARIVKELREEFYRQDQ